MRKLFALILFSSYLCSCVATQQDVLLVQGQMEKLSETILSMQKNQAELAVKMEELSKDLNESSESMKDISSQMTSLSEQLENLDNSMNKRVNAIGQTIKKQQESVENALLPSKMYNEAYAAFQQNNFDEAISGFKKYLVEFPNGDLTEGAYFFLGESLYLKTEWEQAAWSYASMIEKYPKSGRIPAARLKYAQCLLKMPKPKTDEAMKYLKSIVRDYPTSPEAETAKTHIDKYTTDKNKNSADKKTQAKDASKKADTKKTDTKPAASQKKTSK